MPGRSYSGEFLQSWSTLMVELQSAGIQFAISQKYDPVVYYARNRCLGGDLLKGENQLPFQGQTDYDYMMWIDSDIIFKPEHFFKLLQHDEDVVSGLYMMTDLKHYATVEHWDEEYFKTNGTHVSRKQYNCDQHLLTTFACFRNLVVKQIEKFEDGGFSPHQCV